MVVLFYYSASLLLPIIPVVVVVALFGGFTRVANFWQRTVNSRSRIYFFYCSVDTIILCQFVRSPSGWKFCASDGEGRNEEEPLQEFRP